MGVKCNELADMKRDSASAAKDAAQDKVQESKHDSKAEAHKQNM